MKFLFWYGNVLIMGSIIAKSSSGNKLRLFFEESLRIEVVSVSMFMISFGV
jgi:hypothetical protein